MRRRRNATWHDRSPYEYPREKYIVLHDDPRTKRKHLVGSTDDLHLAVDKALELTSPGHDHVVQGFGTDIRITKYER